MYQIGLSEESTAPRLRAEALAIAGIVALQTMLGRRAVHWVGPLPDVQAVAPKAPRKAAAAKAAKKPAMLSGEAFFDARMLACRAAAAEVGASWHLVEGASYWGTIPAKMRKFVTARGSVCKAKPDARLPAPKYWAAGVLPEGIVLMPDMPRDRTPATEIERRRPVRPAGLTAWVMCERGYEIHPMLANLAAAYEEQRERDELLAIHRMFDGMAREREAERARIGSAIIVAASMADWEAEG